MVPETTIFRPSTTKNQRNDLLHELDSFQTSLRNSNASAFNKLGINNSISREGASSNAGFENIEKSLNKKMKNFQQVHITRLFNTYNPFFIGFESFHYSFSFFKE